MMTSSSSSSPWEGHESLRESQLLGLRQEVFVRYRGEVERPLQRQGAFAREFLCKSAPVAHHTPGVLRAIALEALVQRGLGICCPRRLDALSKDGACGCRRQGCCCFVVQL